MNIVVLISGEGTNLQAIIDSIAANKLDASVSCVVSNKKNANGLNRAERAKIPSVVIEKSEYTTKSDFEKALLAAITPYEPDLIVLAGFMCVLSESFVNHYLGKMINIHPSLLPKYRGLRTHQRVLANQDQYHGASIHFVTPDLDGGPVILQGKITVHNNSTEASLTTRVQKVEHIILVKTLLWFCENKISFSDKYQVLYENSPITHGFIENFARI